MSKAHPGFKAVAAKIGKKPGIRNPGAVLAASSRNASPAAKKKNPNLKKVKGKARPMGVKAAAKAFKSGDYKGDAETNDGNY